MPSTHTCNTAERASHWQWGFGAFDGAPVLQTAGGALPVDAALASLDGFSAGRQVIAGIRPEDITVRHGEGQGLRATIEVIEPMGSLNVVCARLGDERIAITPSRASGASWTTR
jgi:ABC-type sugar transport system ATPase subunit